VRVLTPDTDLKRPAQPTIPPAWLAAFVRTRLTSGVMASGTTPNRLLNGDRPVSRDSGDPQQSQPRPDERTQPLNGRECGAVSGSRLGGESEVGLLRPGGGSAAPVEGAVHRQAHLGKPPLGASASSLAQQDGLFRRLVLEPDFQLLHVHSLGLSYLFLIQTSARGGTKAVQGQKYLNIFQDLVLHTMFPPVSRLLIHYTLIGMRLWKASIASNLIP